MICCPRRIQKEIVAPDGIGTRSVTQPLRNTTECINQLLHSVAASEMMSVRARSIVLLSCYSPLSAALDVMRGVQRADCRCDIAAEARTKNPYQYSDLRQRAGRR